MRNMIRRVEKLEQAHCVGAAQVPPQLIRVQYVAPNGEVTDSHVVEIPQPGARTQRGDSVLTGQPLRGLEWQCER